MTQPQKFPEGSCNKQSNKESKRKISQSEPHLPSTGRVGMVPSIIPTLEMGRFLVPWTFNNLYTL